MITDKSRNLFGSMTSFPSLLFPRENISLLVFSPLGGGWTNSSSTIEFEPLFGEAIGFDWTDISEYGLSKDTRSVLGAGLLFCKTFNNPQLRELSGYKKGQFWRR